MSESKKQYAIFPSLANRVVVISGGATGIGASLTEQFAFQESRVIFLDIQDDEAAKLSQDLVTRGAKHKPIYYHCDVTDVNGALKPVVSTILNEFTKIDAVINNAAQDKRLNTMDITPEEWDQGMNVNLRHQFFLTQLLLPALIAAGSSSVINMSSISWALPATGLVPYCASKAGIIGLTKTLAKEFGAQGVRVNSIMPGAIATERQKQEVHTEGYYDEVLGNQALKRIMQPSDVSRLALWLAADDSEGVTSQSIVVDGGWL